MERREHEMVKLACWRGMDSAWVACRGLLWADCGRFYGGDGRIVGGWDMIVGGWDVMQNTDTVTRDV